MLPIFLIDSVGASMTKRVMIVDDDDNIRNYLSNTLLTYGFKVITAANGMDCIDKLKKTEVDLIIMELFLPIVSGVDVIKAIRKSEKLRDTRIAVMSVMDFDMKSMDYLKEKLGVIYIIPKPFEIGNVIYIINTLLKS